MSDSYLVTHRMSDYIEFIKLSEEIELPFRAYGDSVGWDLAACLISATGRKNVCPIAPRTTVKLRTGLALRAPPKHAIMICSRSGHACHSVFVANAPGIIDPSYTGEIIVLLHNGGYEPYYVRHGDRIAQAVVVPYLDVKLREVKKFPPTERGEKAFGSTG